jgi:hypothetical protein
MEDVPLPPLVVPDDTFVNASRHVLPALPEYHGLREGYETWRGKLLAKIRVDGNKMGNHYGMIATILMTLRGDAERNCSTHLNNLLQRDGVTVSDAIRYLDRIYRDPRLKQQALDQWNRLRQGTDNFDTFFAEFERLLAQAEGDQWPEDVKMQALRVATAPEIVRQNVANDNSENMNELANQYRKIASGLAALAGPRVHYAGPYQVTTGSQYHPVNDHMDIDVPGSFNVNVPLHEGRGRGNMNRGSRGRGQFTNYGGGSRVNPDGAQGPGLPSDERLRGRRAVRVNKEELNRRRAAQACLRCGRVGCRVYLCPLAAPPPAVPMAPVNANAAYVEPDLERVMEAATPENPEN